MTETQAVVSAMFFLMVALACAWLFYYEQRLHEYEGFLKSDRMLRLRFDQWKRDQQGLPPGQQPPTD